MATNASGTSPGVILDVDGTLLDTNYLHVLAWWRALRDAGHDDISMAEVHQAIGIANDQLLEHLVGEPDDRAAEAHSQHYDDLRDLVVAFPRTAELVRTCAERGLRVVLATSGVADDLDWMLPAIGAEDSVSGATTSADVEQAKPAPDLMSVTLEKFGLDPQRTVAIGDTVWDVRSAHQADLPCIAFTSGGISAGQLTEAGADEVYDGPADLLDRFDSSLLARMLTSEPDHAG